MPWKHTTRMSERLEFVLLARQEGANVRRLCRRFGISGKTGYKWLTRYAAGGALVDRSRRPRHSPRQSGPAVTSAVLAVRAQHPTWGGRKLRRRLLNLQAAEVPTASTCTEIVRRAGLLRPSLETTRPWQRFARRLPNE